MYAPSGVGRRAGVARSWSRRTTHDIFADLRPISPFVGCIVGMVMAGFMV